ncbi:MULTISPECIES: ScbR family autoregulator-binding transcription factor [unclassified Streptomyces]|uniref:ScbR family autoregulator-binding transcription factor n=1 Tax=Streptomyces johnsoniae TaxID=3075532 RepID=A0ABU2SCL0_9ACTN|nr:MULTISPECIES: ScbR family autoregulator-binding transcription factor [unclassified Streptomyces]MDT0446632.1 ScbR family autoregulator-binding transcription factor [Streptomyces sp. DSM 41886]ONK14117.1 A-factor-binding protein [Streptomyces sp. MP131-18]
MATQQRALRTRRRVIEAAAAVFDEHGYASASITDILRAAGVTKGALYFHFDSKEALARSVMAEQRRSVMLTNTGLHAQTVIDITHGVARSFATNTLLRAGVRLTVEQGVLGESDPGMYHWWTELCRSQLMLAKDHGELRPGASPEDLAYMIIGSFTGVQLLSAVACDRADLVERLTTWWRVALPGMVQESVLPRLRPHGSADVIAMVNGTSASHCCGDALC